MPTDLSKSLVIGISSRALSDLEEANRVFDTEGRAAYIEYQAQREKEALQPGTGFRLVQAILELNKKVKGHRPAEVVVMSRNGPESSFRIYHSIQHHGLDIQRSALTGGVPVACYVPAFSVDLYLSAHEHDVKEVLRAGIPAAVVYGTPKEVADPCEEIRIAFDGDAVLFSDEAERVYKQHGLDKFVEHACTNAAREPSGPRGSSRAPVDAQPRP